MKRYLLILVLAGCTTQPSHIPNPLLLPGQAVVNSFENAHYDARRGRVSKHVTANHPTLIDEIGAGGGPMLTHAMELAWIVGAKQPALIRLLAKDITLYRSDPEALVVALMVHGA